LHIGALMLGAALGAIVRKRVGTVPVIFFAGAVKAFASFMLLVIPGEPEK